MTRFSESVVEEAALDWLSQLGWTALGGRAERTGHRARVVQKPGRRVVACYRW